MQHRFDYPQLNDDLIDRPRLQAQLEACWTCRLTVVVAAAGYGKTTILAQWMQQTLGGDCLWYGLNSPTEAEQLQRLLINLTTSRFPLIKPINSLADLFDCWATLAPRRIALVLDDCQQLQASAWQLLQEVLRFAPTNVHLVISSRQLPQLDWASLAARGQYRQLNAAELRLSAAEIAQLLPSQNPSQREAAWQATNGWPAGLRLWRALPHSYQGTIGAFLAQDVLAQLPAAVRRTAQFAAQLPFFNQAVLTAMAAPDPASIWQYNLFVVPDHDDWWRFEPFWLEVVRQEPLAEVEQLLTQAAIWFDQQGHYEAALDLWCRLGQWSKVVARLKQAGLTLLAQQQPVLHWLQQLPANERQSGELLHLHGLALREHDPVLAAQTLALAAQAYRAEQRYAEAFQVVGEQCLIYFWQGDEQALFAAARESFSLKSFVWYRQRRDLLKFPLLLFQIKRGRYLKALATAQSLAHSELPFFWRWVAACVVGGLYTILTLPNEGIQWIEAWLQHPQVQAEPAMRMSLLDLLATCLMSRSTPEDRLLAQDLADQASLLSERYGVRLTRLQTRGTKLGLALLESDRPTTERLIQQLLQPSDEPLPSIMRHRLLALRAFAWASLGEVKLAQHDATSSERGLIRDDALYGADPRMWLMLAQAWFCCGEYRRALAALDRAKPMIEAAQSPILRLRAGLVQLASRWQLQPSPQLIGEATIIWRDYLTDGDRHMNATPLILTTLLVELGLRTGIAPQRIAQFLAERDRAAIEAICWKLYAELPAQQSMMLQLLGLYGSAASIERLLEVVKQASTQQRKIAQQSLTSIRQRPAYSLKIQLFGSLQLWRGAELVDASAWAREKARQLLALLLLQRPRIISREAVIEQLWPELEHQAADGALRVTLNALLHVLEPERSGGANSAFILSEAAGLRLNPQASITTDYAQFQSLLQTAAQHRQQGAMPAALHAYQSALAIYQDDLLSDLAYAEWVLDWREQALTQFVNATSEYLELLLAYGPTAEAIPYAERLLSYDPYHEPTYQRLIDIYLMLGNGSAAERIRKRLERILL
ncbi:BTAD domain-containing putative transcriptional regulator [Herpetosiphon geysericola]|uniref:Bacterial transcriptional activator domain-containing protein n=1 Tax=Herpetosiphon geysericola TaxID=70996 RepID=A0A0P6YCQ9_9CHLR|nr:BTAD domain-containing putative transcriptional regulator [Herpetosiphon geysericola]KPL91176.1 hypothetical protein SE18_03255 [Herpetosiphon geysericola]